MGYDFILWIVAFVYALHFTELRILNWVEWGGKSARLALTEKDLSTLYVGIFVLAVGTALVGWRQPEFSLILPALAFWDSILFFSWAIRVRRIILPGMITNILLFVVALVAYYLAYLDVVLSLLAFIVSAIGGLLVTLHFMFLLLVRAWFARIRL